MRRISSRATFFHKRVFPVIWFGFLGLLIAAPLLFIVLPELGRGSTVRVDIEPFFFIVLIAMAGFGYLLMKWLVFDLVDEVWDAGDTLIVRNAHREERIALSNIMNVSYSLWVNPPRVTLKLRRPCAFGTKVSFGAPITFIPFSGSPIIYDLIRRIDAARRT